MRRTVALSRSVAVLLPGLWGLLAGWASAPAAEAPAPPVTTSAATQPLATGEDVAALVAQLSSDQWSQRQRAQDRLIVMGEEAAPQLQARLDQTQDAELRTQLHTILQQIDENRKTGPTLVTLRMKKASPQRVFNELARQAHCELPALPEELWTMQSWPAITLDLERQPFWLAMREACGQIGIEPRQVNGRTEGLALMQGGGAMQGPYYCVSGPFLVVANTISRSTANSIALANGQRSANEQLTLMLTVYAEPKLRLLGHNQQFQLTEATDEQGRSLLSSAKAPPFWIAGSLAPDQQLVWSASIMLAPGAAQGATRLASLKGYGSAVLQVRSETVEVPNILSAKEQTRTVGNQRVTIRQVAARGGGYAVRIAIQRGTTGVPAPWALIYPGQGGAIGAIRLLDQENRALSRVEFSPRQASEQEMEYEITFRRQLGPGIPAGEPAKLVWEVPTEVRQIQIPFELKDLPLP